MFNRKKKLTLRQIHELYLLLKPYLPEKEEKYLIDEVDAMLEEQTQKIKEEIAKELNGEKP